MKKHFVMVSIDPREDSLTKKYRQVLDRAIDWIEISPNSWLLWTSTSSNGWLKRLKSTKIPFNRVLIVEVNPADRAGVMPSEVWRFIRKRDTSELEDTI